MFYLDTSLLVSMITEEQGSEGIRNWLGQQSPDSLNVSDWVITEFSSAVSLKMRIGVISSGQRALAMTIFSATLEASMSSLPVEANHFRTAAFYCDMPETKLRAGDALHLAIAAASGLVVCTRDVAMAAAGQIIGIKTHLF
jgi:hypothetical protein